MRSEVTDVGVAYLSRHIEVELVCRWYKTLTSEFVLESLKIGSRSPHLS